VDQANGIPEGLHNGVHPAIVANGMHPLAVPPQQLQRMMGVAPSPAHPFPTLAAPFITPATGPGGRPLTAQSVVPPGIKLDPQLGKLSCACSRMSASEGG
jgi:hypothetical protein